MEKPRLPRVDRIDHYEVEDDSTHLWAVSYADFLMVLLSFFILFFSVDEETKENIIQEITRVTFEQGAEEGHFQRKPDFEKPEGTASLYEQFSQLNVKVEKHQDQLIIHFPDNMYALGAIELPKQGRELIHLVHKNLKSYLDKVDLVMIGHSDSLRFVKLKNKYIRSNFDLSSLRGSRAVRFAIEAGFKESHLFTQGAAMNDRNSRSLSILIRPHKVQGTGEGQPSAKEAKKEAWLDQQLESELEAELESDLEAELNARLDAQLEAELESEYFEAVEQSPIKKWWVQLAAYVDAQDAKNHIARLNRVQFKARALEVKVKGKKWHRVQVGPFKDFQEAKSEQEKGQSRRLRFFNESFLLKSID